MDYLEPEACASLLVRINPYEALHLATDASRHANSESGRMFWGDVIAILKTMHAPTRITPPACHIRKPF